MQPRGPLWLAWLRMEHIQHDAKTKPNKLIYTNILHSASCTFLFLFFFFRVNSTPCSERSSLAHSTAPSRTPPHGCPWRGYPWPSSVVPVPKQPTLLAPAEERAKLCWAAGEEAVRWRLSPPHSHPLSFPAKSNPNICSPGNKIFLTGNCNLYLNAEHRH